MTTEKSKIILVPIDFSETTPKATSYANDLARKLGAQLILYHVMENHPVHFARCGDIDWYTQESVRRVNKELNEIGERHIGKDIAWSTMAQVHHMAEEAIVEQAYLLGAEMIVMGTHGRRGLSHFFLGSTAEQVVRRARCPVMTVSLNDGISRQAA